MGMYQCAIHFRWCKYLISIWKYPSRDFSDRFGDCSESAYDPIDFCTVLGLPQIVIPSKAAKDFVLDIGFLKHSHVLSLGKNPYNSRITGKTEYAAILRP